MRNFKFIAVNGIAIMLLVASACQKVIEPKNLPQQDPRVVLNCVICNDTTIKVNVSASKSILSGKDYKLIDNAVCELYVNDTYAEKLSNIKNGDYISTLKGSAGAKYTVKVNASGYPDAEGSNSVPQPVSLNKSERYDTTDYNFSVHLQQQFSYFGGSLKYRLYIKDDPGTDNYYSIRPLIILLDSAQQPINFPVPVYINTNAKSVGNDNIVSWNSLEADDKTLVNGNEVLFDAVIGFNATQPITSIPYYADMYLYVSSLSNDYYKYKITLLQQQTTGINLFSEPVIVHNNIKNGMGIVGCVNTSKAYLGKVRFSGK